VRRRSRWLFALALVVAVGATVAVVLAFLVVMLGSS
jgi:hypothetical protein